MSAVTAAKSIKIDIISDTVCPFCFLGKRKLERAITAFRKTDDQTPIHIRWHPFNLDPTCTQSQDKRQHFVEKFGAARADTMHGMMSARGKEDGIAFAWGGKRGPTIDSHRVVDLAYEEGGEALQGAIMESLLKAYHEEELDIADHAVIVQRAKEAGMDGARVEQLLASDERMDKVQADIEEANRRGIHGVPHFTFNDKREVSGAQDASTFLYIMQSEC